MNYSLLKDIIDLLEQYEENKERTGNREKSVEDFRKWIVLNAQNDIVDNEPDWEGKEDGRSPESVINTLIIHMNRYAKSYSKSAIHGSEFSTQDDFIYMITLNVFGEMSKMDLIKKNVQEKPAGMQIINRLIAQKWVTQRDSEIDKRSKVLSITDKGIDALQAQMDKIRQATSIVTGDLTYNEKMELIRLLNKLNDFHLPIYEQNLEPEKLLETVVKDTKS